MDTATMTLLNGAAAAESHHHIQSQVANAPSTELTIVVMIVMFIASVTFLYLAHKGWD